MASLEDVQIFVKVAQFESINQAARSLDTQNSTASQQLSMLEPELGVSLLRRTMCRETRHLRKSIVLPSSGPQGDCKHSHEHQHYGRR
jgi:hypothetical protein